MKREGKTRKTKKSHHQRRCGVLIILIDDDDNDDGDDDVKNLRRRRRLTMTGGETCLFLFLLVVVTIEWFHRETIRSNRHENRILVKSRRRQNLNHVPYHHHRLTVFIQKGSERVFPNTESCALSLYILCLTKTKKKVFFLSPSPSSSTRCQEMNESDRD